MQNKRLTAPLLLAFTLAFAASGARGITADEKSILQKIRNSIFGGSQLTAAFEQHTISGQQPPVFPYELRNRVILVWRIPEAAAGQFAAAIDLPQELSLARVAAPVEPLAQRTCAERASLDAAGTLAPGPCAAPRHYYLLADIANTSRAERGAKIEWKTFVSGASDPTPRLYRFDKASSAAGLDLLEIENPVAADLTLRRRWDRLTVRLAANTGDFSAVIPLQTGGGHVPRPRLARFTREFLTAGELTLGPNGTASRYFYDGSSAVTGFVPVPVDQVVAVGTLPWFAYVEQLEDVIVPQQDSEYLVQPVTRAIPVTAPPGPFCPSSAEGAADASGLFACLVVQALGGQPRSAVLDTLATAGEGLGLEPAEVATLHYAVVDLYQALQVYLGIERPKLFFTLKPDPKAIFINFEIPPHKVEAFEQAYLPEGFRLAKIRFYPEQEKALYAVSLNVYEAAGQNLDGFRAEWSTYVLNPAEVNPRPRFSVLEAQSTTGGFDPIIALERYELWLEEHPGESFDFQDPEALFALIEEPNTDFTYSLDTADGIRIRLDDIEEGIRVDVDIAYPAGDRVLRTVPRRSWMEANDFVYWGEVADILKYDSNVMFAELLVFEALPTDRIIDTAFRGFVNPRPLPIILWNGKQDIALEPWGNLNSVDVEE